MGLESFFWQQIATISGIVFLGIYLFYLRNKYQSYYFIFDEIPYPLLVTDLDAKIIGINSAFTEVTGYSLKEVKGQKASILNSGKQPAEFYDDLWKDLVDIGSWSGELWNKRKDGELYLEYLTIRTAFNRRNKPYCYIGLFIDLSERQQYEKVIEQLAFYDPLTNLPNRTLLSDRINHALKTSKLSHHSLAILFIDLDNFKSLNDSYGHDIGDLYLQEVSKRLSSVVKTSDTVCRWGGDEFVILLEGLSLDREEMAIRAENVAQRIIHSLRKPFDISQTEYIGGASIGISLLENNSTEQALLKNADSAMNQAKMNGKNQVSIFDARMQLLLEQHLKVERELRQAIYQDQLELYLQPQVNSDGEVLSAEGLVRWNHPEKGLILPNDFIPIAEKSELIIELGDWVLNQACLILKHWQEIEIYSEIKLSVNISCRQLKQQDFADKLIQLVESYQVQANKLKLEITETSIMRDIDGSAEKMHLLEAYGFEFSMDDFGTGYSSLSYIQNLPIQQIKIDRTFVSNLLSATNSSVLTKIIIDMADSLNLNLIAEGVENEAQQQALKDMGCENFQGYLFGKPMSKDHFEQLFSAEIKKM